MIQSYNYEICLENGGKNLFLDDRECGTVKKYLCKGILYFPKMYPINTKKWGFLFKAELEYIQIGVCHMLKTKIFVRELTSHGFLLRFLK